jgi:uncharacterized phiE125 gp8 family phage protein
MRVFVVTPPAPVVTLEEAKTHCKVRHEEEDNLIEMYVAAATKRLDGPDGWLGLAIGEQTLEARFDSWCASSRLDLRYPPIIDLVSVKWLGADRSEITGDLADVELIDRTVYPIASAPWSGGHWGREAIRIRYRAGYADVPEQIKAAICLMTADLYRSRETFVVGVSAAAVPMSTTVENLLDPIRVYA